LPSTKFGGDFRCSWIRAVIPDNNFETSQRLARLPIGAFAFQSGVEAVRRIGLEWPQFRVEAETCPTIWTEDGVLVGHVDIDVRVVVGRRYANALELLRPDADLRNCDVIPESWIDLVIGLGHGGLKFSNCFTRSGSCSC